MAYQNISHDKFRELDSKHHLHPFTDHARLRRQGSRIITGGDGAYVIDADGERILDAMSGLWCVNLGYSRPELVKAATAQLTTLPYYNSFFKSSVPSAVLLAKRLAELSPMSGTQVFFGTSGSEAIDTAIRLVRHYWTLAGQPKKQILIARQNAYHGSTIAGASLSGMPAMHDQLPIKLAGIVHVMAPYAFEEARPGESLTDFGIRAAASVEQAILASGAENVAAFFGEPIQGAGGLKIPPENYWPEVERICRKHNVLLVGDEVITGFGRTGQWFGCQAMNFSPDIITVAKALTSGYLPLSAVLVNDTIADTLIARGGEFFHGYTYSAHPVCCALALENLKIIEQEGLIERVRMVSGPMLSERLKSILEDHPLVGEIRTFGLLGAIEIVADKATRQRFPGEVNAGEVVRDLCFANNFIMRSVGDTMVFAPPLIWGEAEIDLFTSRCKIVFDLALDRLRQ